jgi:hypothetical protein
LDQALRAQAAPAAPAAPSDAPKQFSTVNAAVAELHRRADERRDARKYGGPWPVVAHPPCSRWCRLAGLVEARWGHKRGDDGGCFASALMIVRLWGGVLEHPEASSAFPHHGIPRPNRQGGRSAVHVGWRGHQNRGWVWCVEQGHYGHASRKGTWLLANTHSKPQELNWTKGEQRLPQWMIERYGYEKARRIGVVAMVGGKNKTAIRNATPEPFRDLLLSIARQAHNVGIEPPRSGRLE